MFLTPLLTALVGAAKRTFDADYLEPDFRELRVSTEFPAREVDYPGLWVNFEPVGDVEIMGVDHLEFGEPGLGGARRPFTRWRFGGYAVYTIATLSSLERARLFDELVRVIAFGREAAQTQAFRAYIENNRYLAINANFDRLRPRGFSEAQGTPWGTDEIVYEASVAIEIVGECLNDPTTTALMPLTGVVVHPYHDREPDPATVPGSPLAPPESWR